YERGDGGPLILRLVAPEVRANLEESGVGEALAGVAGRGLDQVRQGRGTHAVEFRGDRVGQPQLLVAAAELPGPGRAHEAPGDRLGIAAGGQRAAGITHARLANGER